MLRWLLRRRIESFERKWDYDASYLKEIADLSSWAALKFALATSLGSDRRGRAACRPVCGRDHRRAVRRLWPVHAAGDHDGRAAGRASRDPAGLLQDDVAAMPDDVALAWRFTRATLAHDETADDYRGEIVRRWGPRAVVTLAFAITTARMYPTVKYAMGHGKICSRVVVDGAPLAIDRGLTDGPWPLTSTTSQASRAS